METKTILSVPPEIGRQLSQIQSSIQRQSLLLGQVLMRFREVESGLQTLYGHQQGLVGQIVEKAGLNPDSVAQLNLSPDGSQIVVTLKPVSPAVPVPVPGS